MEWTIRVLTSSAFLVWLAASLAHGQAPRPRQAQQTPEAMLQQRVAALEKEVQNLKSELTTLRVQIQRSGSVERTAIPGTGPNPNGSEYLDKWVGTERSNTERNTLCLLDISNLGESFVAKIQGETIPECRYYEGVFTLTPEGNLKGGLRGELLIAFDRARNQAVVSGFGQLRYLTRARVYANEFATAALLRTIGTSNETYAATYSIGFAGKLAHLGVPTNSCPEASSACADLINLPVFESGERGYTFTYLAPSPAPTKSAPNRTFSVVAIPVSPGISGASTFCWDQANQGKKDPTGKAAKGTAAGCSGFAGDPF